MLREKIKKSLVKMGFMLALAATIISCRHVRENVPWGTSPDEDYITLNDSALIAQEVSSIVNPQFNSVEEVLLFKAKTIEGCTIDSVFQSMPDEVLENVASVLIKKIGYADKTHIVKEYRANQSIYDSLPSSNTPSVANKDTIASQVDRTGTDLGNRRDGNIISTSYQYRTDTIDGKPVKIQIKKEEKYVE